jgi:hypothetical protein
MKDLKVEKLETRIIKQFAPKLREYLSVHPDIPFEYDLLRLINPKEHRNWGKIETKKEALKNLKKKGLISSFLCKKNKLYAIAFIQNNFVKNYEDYIENKQEI